MNNNAMPPPTKAGATHSRVDALAPRTPAARMVVSLACAVGGVRARPAAASVALSAGRTRRADRVLSLAAVSPSRAWRGGAHRVKVGRALGPASVAVAAAAPFQEGVAQPEAIDGIMKLGMNHPIGPLALADLIGLDTILHIMNVLYDGFEGDPKYAPSQLLKDMVSEGKLGRKSGEGFYNYK